MVGQTGPPRDEPLLKRQIGLYAATAITVGSIIGSGIFRSPHSVAQELTGPVPALVAWVLGGILSLCGSLALAEMAVTHPRTGGLYVFIRESFGNRLAFIFGWASLWVIKPTVIASIASVFATYFCQAVGLPKGAEFFAGFGAIALLTFVNLLGVKQGTGTQTVLTTLKVLGILGLCLDAFLLPHAGPPAGQVLNEPHHGHPFLLAFAFAMIPIFFAYDGWTDSTYVGGETVNPAKNFPIAILGGRPRAGRPRRGLDLRHRERVDPHRPARHARDGRGRALLEARRARERGPGHAGRRALDPGSPRDHLALVRGRVRGRVGMVRHDLVALLRTHDRGPLR